MNHFDNQTPRASAHRIAGFPRSRNSILELFRFEILRWVAFAVLGFGTFQLSAQSPGQPNPSFADPLITATSPSGTTGVYSIALDSNGKVLVLGNFNLVGGSSLTYGNLARFNADGSVDTTFQNPNVVPAITSGRVIVLPDGKILIGGNFTSIGSGSPAYTQIARLNADGSVDSTFVNPGISQLVRSIAVDSSGRIYATGSFSSVGGNTTYNRVARFQADGSLDTSFVPAVLNNAGFTITVDAAGKVYVGGSFTSATDPVAGTLSRRGFVRLNSDGSIDTTYQDLNLASSGTLIVRSIVFDSNGKALVLGNFSTAGSGNATRVGIARFNLDGSLDSTFADPNLSGVAAGELAIDSSGKILATSGFSTVGAGNLSYARLARFNTDGTVDTTFSNPAIQGTSFALALKSDGDIYIGGTFSQLGSPSINRGKLSLVYGTPPPPTISTVSAPAAGSYRAGQSLSFTATFSAAVTVSGAPRVSINVGGNARNATYVSGSGTSSLVFTYTIQAGDSDSDGIAVVSPIALNSGTIKNATGTDALLTFTPPATSSVLVDTSAPGLSISAPSATMSNGGSITYTATYSDADFSAATLTPENITLNATGTANAAVGVSGSGTSRTITLSGITGNGSLGISIAAGTGSDVAGNLAGSAGPSATFTVDTTAPGVTISAPSGSTTAGGPITYTISYSDANFSSASLIAGNITLNRTGTADGSVNVSGTGSTRTVTVQGITGDGTLGISIAAGTAVDAAGNSAAAAGPSATFSVDNTGPSVAISAPSSSSTSGGPVSYTVTYTDANFSGSTLSAGNITLNSNGTAAGSIAVTGTGTTRTVTISGITGSGSLGISVAGGTASDQLGNLASAAGPSATFLVDNTAPSIGVGAPSASIVRGGPVTYLVTYTDSNFSASSLSPSDVTLNKTGTANGSIGISGTGSSRTVTISSVTGDGTLGISIAAGTAADLAGNTAPASGPSATFAVDNSGPTIGISGPSSSVTRNGPVSYLISYSGSDFNASTLSPSDITLNTTGTCNAIVGVSGTGATRTVTLSTITGTGTLGISIGAGSASDSLGNLSAAKGPSATVTVDNTAPLVSMAGSTNSNGIYGAGEVIGITIVFTEPVTVTGIPQLILETGVTDRTIDYTSGSGTDTLLFNYTVQSGDISQILDYLGSSALSLNGGTIHDAAGNDASLALPVPGGPGSLSSSRSIVINSSAPTDIALGATTLAENSPVGTIVGSLTAIDPDAGDTSSFTLVSGAGSEDNAAFSISGSSLKTATSIDFETKSIYGIRIRATDSGGHAFEKVFSIGVTDINEAPSFSGYSLTVSSDATTILPVAKIVARSTDPENSARTLSLSTGTSAQGGTVQQVGATLRYTPAIGYSGPDSFGINISDGLNSVPGMVSVTVGNQRAGNGLALISITAVGSDFVLKFSGAAGARYQIQRSGNLTAPATWTTLTTVTADSSGFVSYTDIAPPSPSFWRTLAAP